MSLRSTSHLLVIMMLLASGRLLACGWECLDELATPEVASCHTESASATGISGEASHACLPDIPEPHVTVAKLATDQWLMAVAPVATIVPQNLLAVAAAARQPRPRFESPHLPGFSVLRI